MSVHTKHSGIAWLESQPRTTQVAIIRDILELGRIVATHVMNQEVTELAGERYSRDKPHGDATLVGAPIQVEFRQARSDYRSKCLAFATAKPHSVFLYPAMASSMM